MRRTTQYLSGAPVPDGAPLKCRMGYHEMGGPGSYGTLGYTCTECSGFYGHDRDYSHLTAIGDAMIGAGLGDKAVDRITAEIEADR